MATRAREEEKDVLPQYLVNLHRTHEDWFHPGRLATGDKESMVADMLRSTLRLPPSPQQQLDLAADSDRVVREHARNIVTALPESIKCVRPADRCFGRIIYSSSLCVRLTGGGSR